MDEVAQCNVRWPHKLLALVVHQLITHSCIHEWIRDNVLLVRKF
uniref:Uncharacterized protein n=1 Tax=Ciona intestinalis TaxID=7719 RepID=H2XTW1_CIOIN